MGEVNLRVSMDGQFFSDDRTPFAFNADDSPKGASPGTLVLSKGGSADLELLPFNPDRCVFLEMNDITALTTLSVSECEMSPAFDPAVYMYYVLLRQDQLGAGRVLQISATPSTSSAKVYVGGHPVDWSEAVSVRLNLGENRVAVTVQAPNGAAVRTYMITAYVLTVGLCTLESS
jgi:hypothetical protein